MKKKKIETTYEKINLITKDLFPSVEKDDTLHWENKRLFFKGKEVTRETLKDFSTQARVLKELPLFKILTDEMKLLAQKKIFDDTLTLEDMKIARMILWTIDVLGRKIDNLSKM